MNVLAKKAYEFSFSRIFAGVGSIASIASVLWLIYEQYILKSDNLLPLIVAFFSTIILLVICIYSVQIRQENLLLKEIPHKIHQINHIYRDKLSEVFSRDHPIDNRDYLIDTEESVLRSVCQRIEKIYSRMVGSDCLVTIKLIAEEEDGARFAQTYVRSIDDCDRDSRGYTKYTIGTGTNTAFDKALQIVNNGKLSCFFSSDLNKDLKENNYSNQRSEFSIYYRSAIVVPIRCTNYMNSTDDIGFLCVDSKSVNRLSSGYQVELLAAFADQMYNFMSLMRGKYHLTF